MYRRPIHFCLNLLIKSNIFSGMADVSRVHGGNDGEDQIIKSTINLLILNLGLAPAKQAPGEQSSAVFGFSVLWSGGNSTTTWLGMLIDALYYLLV